MKILRGFKNRKKSWKGLEERQFVADNSWIIEVIKDEKVLETFSTTNLNSNLWTEVDKFELSLGLPKIELLTAPDGTIGEYSMFQKDYQETGETHGLEIV